MTLYAAVTKLNIKDIINTRCNKTSNREAIETELKREVKHLEVQKMRQNMWRLNQQSVLSVSYTHLFTLSTDDAYL